MPAFAGFFTSIRIFSSVVLKQENRLSYFLLCIILFTFGMLSILAHVYLFRFISSKMKIKTGAIIKYVHTVPTIIIAVVFVFLVIAASIDWHDYDGPDPYMAILSILAVYLVPATFVTGCVFFYHAVFHSIYKKTFRLMLSCFVTICIFSVFCGMLNL